MGISAQHALTYAANAQGAPVAFAAYSRNIARYRKGVAINAGFTSEDRDEQEKAGVKPDTGRK